jgi:uncharacterized phage protein (TIGR01671 family)
MTLVTRRKFQFRVWFPYSIRRGNEWTGKMINDMSNADMFRAAETDDYILMESTGLPDSRNRIIFEGDIIKWHEEIYTVVFYQGCFCLTERDRNLVLEAADDGCEVMGNVYENPELLNGQ